MRIIAGSFKGRRLAEPKGLSLRPTSDNLRETLFNVLQRAVEGARVLDGFAGTGALGLEALSRGAARVTFVESDRRAIALIEENIRRCRAEKACVIVKRDFLAGSPGAPRPGRGNPDDVFDLVLLDPPYDVVDLEAIVTAGAPLVAEAGRLVLEHSRRRSSPETDAAGSIRRVRLLAAGDSALSFYER
jgi:16S rRNA (guanine(966)-N(2))-methyltransferase RsmD